MREPTDILLYKSVLAMPRWILLFFMEDRFGHRRKAAYAANVFFSCLPRPVRRFQTLGRHNGAVALTVACMIEGAKSLAMSFSLN